MECYKFLSHDAVRFVGPIISANKEIDAKAFRSRTSMMNSIALLIVVFLAGASAFHFYWALGGKTGWNVSIPHQKDGTPLFVPPKLATAAVALLLLMIAATVALFALQVVSIVPRNLQRAGIFILALIFLARGLSWHQYVGLFKSVRSTEFARNDTWFYSPACVATGSGLLYLSWLG